MIVIFVSQYAVNTCYVTHYFPEQ